ncbi:MAG: hypothetical protein AB7Q81_24450 [Gammaproteobacteria bacterium]
MSRSTKPGPKAGGMNLKPIQVRPDARMRAALERHAKAERRSLAAQALIFIEEGLARAS